MLPEESKLKPAVKVLKRVERLSAARQEQGAQKRQLDTEIASGSSAAAEQQGAKKQETLAECTHSATRAKCDEAARKKDSRSKRTVMSRRAGVLRSWHLSPNFSRILQPDRSIRV